MNDTEMDRMSNTSENISMSPSPDKVLQPKIGININNLGPLKIQGPMKVLMQNEEYDFSRLSIAPENSGIVFNDT